MERLFENLGSVKQPKLPGTLPQTPQGGRRVYSTPYEHPAARSQRADTCWVMACGHKTQFFMKNEGQQKCLVKAMHLNCFVGQKLRSINNSLNQYFNSSHPITYIGYISNFIQLFLGQENCYSCQTLFISYPEQLILYCFPTNHPSFPLSLVSS